MLNTHADLKYLPQSLYASLALIPSSASRIILLTRHSIREESPNQGGAGYHLALTEEGRRLAKAWGAVLADALLPHQFTHCISSPVPRCVDTAEELLESYNKKISQDDSIIIKTQGLLVEPGSFVVDVEQAGPIFLQQGALNFINGILNNSLPGTKIPVQAVKDILQMLFEQRPDNHNNMLLAVSHDTILAAMLAVLSGKASITWDDWPEMMEGVFMWFDDNITSPSNIFEDATLHWIWRGQSFSLAMQALVVISDYE